MINELGCYCYFGCIRIAYIVHNSPYMLTIIINNNNDLVIVTAVVSVDFFHTGPSKFQTQSSLPSFPPKTKQPNYSRSISYPVDNQKKVMWCEKIPGNRAWKIFDRHHDRIVNILRSDAVLCDTVLKILADMFLIGIAERGFIQQLTSLDIKSKAIMRRVSTFISKARNPVRAFVKFSAIIEEFDYFKAIYEEIKFEGSTKHL